MSPALATSPKRIRSIGLTGGIGSGKSTVATRLVELGATLIDTDAIARQLTQRGGAAMPLLKGAFGNQVVAADGALNRDRMRELAFADPSAKSRLEAILHPMIGEQARDQADRAGRRMVVYDIPLLTEASQWRTRVDRILVVDCEEETQVLRVMTRSAWSEDAVRRVIAQQATRARRRVIADAVIYNEGLALPDLADQVRRLWSVWDHPGSA